MGDKAGVTGAHAESGEGASLVKAHHVHVCCILQILWVHQRQAVCTKPHSGNYPIADHDSWDARRSSIDDDVHDLQYGTLNTLVPVLCHNVIWNQQDHVHNKSKQVQSENVLQADHIYRCDRWN